MLADMLAKAFAGREDVTIIMDRRRAERRIWQQPVAVDRRQAARRRPREKVFEVVIGSFYRPGAGPEGRP